MAIRNFSFTLISANNLPDVRSFGTMKVYAHISLRGVAGTKVQTSTDEINGMNPKWNTCQEYRVLQSSFQEGPSVILDVQLFCQRTFGHDKYVGQVNMDLKTLLEDSLSNSVSMTVIVDETQTTEGTLEFSYNFGEVMETVADDQVKEDKQSFLGEVVKQSTVKLLSEGVKTVVLSMLGA